VRHPANHWSLWSSATRIVVLLALAGALALKLAPPQLKEWLHRKKSPLEGLSFAVVTRADLMVMLTTAGKIDSAERTLIECQLERAAGGTGQAASSGGSSTVLSVIADGTLVKEGDILCELDASEYQELLRQQLIAVEQARVDHRQAELNLEVAMTAVVEFREGLLKENLQQLKGQIALDQAALERCIDRLKWAQRMLDKGYTPVSQYLTDEVNERKASFQLRQSRLGLEIFERYSAPKTLRTLEGQVLAAQVMMAYQERRLRMQLEREQLLRKQLEYCTIRAPHDGLVTYAIQDNRPVPIEEGMVVRRRQDLFYLPNLDTMIARAMIHESVANRV